MLYITRGEKRAQIEDPKRARRFKWATVKRVFTDGHIYLQALICASNTVPNNGLKFTMPQIIRNMGFTSTNAQLLSAPPYFAGAIAAVVSSLRADKLSRRMHFIVFFQSIVVVSMGVLFQYAPHIATDIPTCYTMVVLACLGVYPIVPGCNAWTVNNLAAAEKRSMREVCRHTERQSTDMDRQGALFPCMIAATCPKVWHRICYLVIGCGKITDSTP
jgi:hypothetical protein